MVKTIDENRYRIGLPSLDSELKKKVIYLKNKNYIFPRMSAERQTMDHQTDVEALKKYLIKLYESSH